MKNNISEIEKKFLNKHFAKNYHGAKPKTITKRKDNSFIYRMKIYGVGYFKPFEHIENIERSFVRFAPIYYTHRYSYYEFVFFKLRERYVLG